MIPEALNSSGQVVDEMVAPLLIKIVGPQFTVQFMAGEHMEGTHNDGVGNGHDRPLSPATGGQALIQGRQVGPFGPRSSVSQLRQAGPQGAIALAGLARACLPALS